MFRDVKPKRSSYFQFMHIEKWKLNNLGDTKKYKWSSRLAHMPCFIARDPTVLACYYSVLPACELTVLLLS